MSEELGLAVGDMWDEVDPYDLIDEAIGSFTSGISPKSFVETVFEEDLARLESEETEFEQSLEASEEFADEDE